MLSRSILAILFALFASFVNADVQPTRDATRGELLYTTHCTACHTTEAHLRENKLVTDWTSLLAQIRRWQNNSVLEWNNADIEQVAEYLNSLYYHFAKRA